MLQSNAHVGSNGSIMNWVYLLGKAAFSVNTIG